MQTLLSTAGLALALLASTPEPSETVDAPVEEGVYDLEIALVQRRLTAPFAGPKALMQRKLQFVVIDHQDANPGDRIRLAKKSTGSSV